MMRFIVRSTRFVIPSRRGAATRNLLSSVVILILATLAFAQAKHPFTFEDMMKLKRVGEPEVSPDGKWVIFSVVDVDLAANTKTPHIWIVPTAGGQEREIISDQDADRPRWAPHGKRFAFISTKEGGSQLWSADFDGAAGMVTGIHKLTSIATEAGGELWSPDGTFLLFTSDVYPECNDQANELACNAKKLQEHEQSKVKALVFEHLLYRHWNAYKEGKRTHLFVIGPCMGVGGSPAGNDGSRPPANGKDRAVCPYGDPRDLTPGDYDAPMFSLGAQDNYAFSPDGKEICYTSNHDKNPAASTNNDLWIVPVNFDPDATSAQVLAQTKDITTDNPASDSTPLYSPDGRYIAYRAQQRPGYESDRFRLMLYDRKTGEKKNLTEDFDGWVESFTWMPDSKNVYFTSAELGRGGIYEMNISTEKIAPLIGGSDDALSFSSDGNKLFFTQNGLTYPNEIFAVSPAEVRRGVSPLWPSDKLSYVGESGSAAARQANLWHAITHTNDSVLSHVSMYHSNEFFAFQGAHGHMVQGLIVRPPNFDASKKYPVKFLIHGGPQGAWGDDWSYRWNPELFASPTSAASGGYVVIMINFHGSTGYGQKFIDAVNGDWGGAPFEDLMKGLDYAEKTYPFIDKDRECALGASYGGYMVNWILGHTDRFKCIVSHDGLFNTESGWGTTEELWYFDWEFKGTPYDNRAMYEKWSPHQYAKNFKTPTLVIHGQSDYRYDVSESLQLFTTLQMEGVPSKMLYFPDEGHWVLKPQNSQLWYKTVNDWVDQWTKDQGTQK
jgi:dipeptidyl aminopeptidase/acylaminoacyl peptidase